MISYGFEFSFENQSKTEVYPCYNEYWKLNQLIDLQDSRWSWCSMSYSVS